MTTDELVNLGKMQLFIDKAPKKPDPFELQRKSRPTFCKGIIITENDDGKHGFSFTKDALFTAII